MARRKNPYLVKHKATSEEIKNDPSLQWFPYQRGELIWSDERGEYVRFRGYDASGRVQLSTLAAIAPIEGNCDPLIIRRPRARAG